MNPFKKCNECGETKEWRLDFHILNDKPKSGKCKICTLRLLREKHVPFIPKRIGFIDSYKAKQSASIPGQIYFVQQQNQDAYIKIGFTSVGIEKRCNKNMFTDNPYKMIVLMLIDGFAWQEHLLHNLLKDFNVQGEWFQPVPEVLNIIKLAEDNKLSDLPGW